MWGSDTADNMQPTCPIFFIFWYLIEAYCFYREFNETVEYCIQGKMSFEDILEEYKQRNNVTIKTNVLRVVNYLISLIGFYLVISSEIVKDNIPIVLLISEIWQWWASVIFAIILCIFV